METILNYIESLNSSRYFAGVVMLLLNLGSKYISMELSQTHESFLGSKIVRRLLIFTIAFTATRDIMISFVLTASFIILVSGLFHDESQFCLIPKRFRAHSDGTKKVTEEELKFAKSIIESYDKQQNNQGKIDQEMASIQNDRKNKYRKNIRLIQNKN